VKSECGSEEGKKSDLHGGVVEDLVLSTLVLGISVLELSSYSAVSRRNGHTSRKDTTSLEHNSTSYPGQSTIDEGSGRWSNVLVGLWINAGKAGKHGNVWDLDLVEEEETVVHGAVSVRLFNNARHATYL